MLCVLEWLWACVQVRAFLHDALWLAHYSSVLLHDALWAAVASAFAMLPLHTSQISCGSYCCWQLSLLMLLLLMLMLLLLLLLLLLSCFHCTGASKILFELPLLYFILAKYAVACLLTVVAKEAITAVAWDSAGVTTGPGRDAALFCAVLCMLCTHFKYSDMLCRVRFSVCCCCT
jgi:hypothetical protein